jgi:hypothetical protein
LLDGMGEPEYADPARVRSDLQWCGDSRSIA